MKENAIRKKSFGLAVRIVELYKHLSLHKKEYVLSKQLLKSGTSVGAMVREAEHAESKKDFIHKLAIAQKEANETIYWLELLHETGYITKKEFNSILPEARVAISVLTSIIKTMKRKEL